ncbi:MAG: TerB family tellurite resistance protein, partial [Crocinitomicaceae bacterium]|nr:TerB family tellurite resistance protein [Crocinitomicaceae bacterium]
MPTNYYSHDENQTPNCSFRLLYLYCSNDTIKRSSLAVVIKADGKEKDDEYDYIWKFIDSQYSNKRRLKYMVRLETEYLKETIDYKEVCESFNDRFNEAARTQLLYVLVGVATSDWLLGKAELTLLQNIAKALDIMEATLTANLAMFRYQKQWREKKPWDDDEEGESWRFFFWGGAGK